MPARNLDWSGASADGNFSTANNWIDLATGVAALAAPITGDSCFFNRTSDAVTAGLSQAAVDLVTLAFGPGFTGSIGAIGTSLSIGVTTQLTYAARCSICNITAGTNGIALASVGGSGTVSLTGGTTTLLVVGPSGNVSVGASAVVTGLDNSGGVQADAGTAFTTTKCGAGTLVSARNLGTLYAGGQGTTVRATGAATLTAGYILGGSRLNWNSTGTITAAEIFAGGTGDARGAILGFTITTKTVHPGASYAWDSESVNVTVGTTKDYRKLI